MSYGAIVPSGRGLWLAVILLGKYLSAAAAGIALGLVLTWFVIDRKKGFGSIEAGPWTSFSRIGTADVEPYSRAILAYYGETPLSESEAMSFVAYGDSSGADFNGDCDYAVSGEVPLARYWTLTLYSPEGALMPNPANRYGFTSSEILRNANGRFEITIARHARPGNWLPSGDAARFVLVLRLYDGELSTASGTINAGKMPVLVEGSCE
jgi:hypothetical protein